MFFWGQKQERTATWYSMFLETGERTESIDSMQFSWTNAWPENRAPHIESIKLRNRRPYASVKLTAFKTYTTKIEVSDPDGDALSFRWHVKTESTSTAEGGDSEARIPDIHGLIDDPTKPQIKLKAPPTLRAYRLFVEIYDGNGNAAHDNFPFYVYKQ